MGTHILVCDHIFQLLNSCNATEKMWSHRPYIWLTEIFESGTDGCIH